MVISMSVWISALPTTVKRAISASIKRTRYQRCYQERAIIAAIKDDLSASIKVKDKLSALLSRTSYQRCYCKYELSVPLPRKSSAPLSRSRTRYHPMLVCFYLRRDLSDLRFDASHAHALRQRLKDVHDGSASRDDLLQKSVSAEQTTDYRLQWLTLNSDLLKRQYIRWQTNIASER